MESREIYYLGLAFIGLATLVAAFAVPTFLLVKNNLKLAARPFVIGRFDVSIGRKQCDFEFDKTTKAVSRRHAAIELTAGGFAIVDLDSRAGTFVNGNKVTPGQPHPIQHGDVVSFGGMGAEYVFEA